jgi:hypothetical protein
VRVGAIYHVSRSYIRIDDDDFEVRHPRCVSNKSDYKVYA